jgi:acyl carrier protein
MVLCRACMFGGIRGVDTEIRQFLVDTLRQMNYDVSDVTGETVLGPAGLDLESLAVAELAVSVEDKYAVTFTEKDTEDVALMSLDEFAGEIARRLDGARAATTR